MYLCMNICILTYECLNLFIYVSVYVCVYVFLYECMFLCNSYLYVCV